MRMKLLIGLIALIGLSAVVGAVVMGTMSFDGLVVEKPYENGLKWDEVRNKKIRLGWTVELMSREPSTGTNDVAFIAMDSSGRPIEGAVLKVAVKRPSGTAYDRTYETKGHGGGIYIAQMDFPLKGYWNMDVEVGYKGETVVYKELLYVK